MTPPNHTDEVFTLWDELSDFGTHASDAALNHCLATLSRWLNAQHAFWVGIVHVMEATEAQGDTMGGWRFGAMHPPVPGIALPNERNGLLVHTDDEARWGRSNAKMPPGATDAGATNLALAATAGRFRAYTLRSGALVELNAFEATPHYDYYYRAPGVFDRIWVLFPINADAESCFCFDRLGTDLPPFTEEERDLAAFALRGIKWFHRHLLMTHGLGVSEAPLTAAEHRMVKQLLTGGSEKTIAKELGMSQGTVHQYATRIYRKFGVRGRAEFTALWLRGK